MRYTKVAVFAAFIGLVIALAFFTPQTLEVTYFDRFAKQCSKFVLG